MDIKYLNSSIPSGAVEKTLHKLINQIYKLLPLREEGADWIKPLEILIVELAGLNLLTEKKYDSLFLLLCKLEGLKTLTAEEDFLLFRRVIFESIGLLDEIKESND